jgi:hypothetical protein
MPDDPSQPPAPRPVVPIEPGEASSGDELIDAEIMRDASAGVTPPPMPVVPIAEPGVVPPAPFAQVYSPPAPPVAPAYYPPAYPPPQAYPAPHGYAPQKGYAPPGAYPPAWPEPVDYRGGLVRSYSRPGIITAMAVTAMIVAALSVVTSFFSGCTSLAVMNNSRKASSAGRASVAYSTVPAPGASITLHNTNALGDSDRAAVITALRTRRALSDERLRQIDGFLAEHGKLVFDDTNGGLTSKGVLECLGEQGQEFASQGKAGPAFFVFKSAAPCKLAGRLRVFDTRAVYKPDDYSPDLRSETKAEETPFVTPQANAAQTLANGLEDEQVQAVLGRVQGLSSGKLNAAQANTLTGLLQTPTYAGFLQDSTTIPGLTAQVKSAAIGDDGGVTISFTMGKLMIDSNGNVISPMPAQTKPTAAATMPSGFGWGPTVIVADHGSCEMATADAFFSGLLAIYLLVIAILTLRRNPIGKKFFIIYAVVKLICGVIGLMGFIGIINSLSASIDTLGIARSWFGGMANAAAVLTGIGLAYPIAVLLVLTMNQTAKDYYKTAG